MAVGSGANTPCVWQCVAMIVAPKKGYTICRYVTTLTLVRLLAGSGIHRGGVEKGKNNLG